MSETRFYHIWCAMKQRCLYPKHNRYKNYGGRGIKICEEWLDFKNFAKDMYDTYLAYQKFYKTKKISIDRINTNGNYTKENCRWSTLWQQNLNRTNNRLLTYKGITKPMTQWAREKGFKRGCIDGRLARGWSIERSFETPSKNKLIH